MLTLSSILQNDEAKRLEAALASKGESHVLRSLGNPDNARWFMKACLRGSYLFGRHTVPSYISHVFHSLTHHAPANDVVGKTLNKLMNMCVGELSTNNIFCRDGECHAHFHDLYEAYVDAGGDTVAFAEFMRQAEHGTWQAIWTCADLWSIGSTQVAGRLLKCCDSPLASFILMPCNETLTTIIYPPALKSLSKEPQFDKFRRFLEVHVQLDGEDHGYVALEWLDLYLRHAKPHPCEVADATKMVLSLYEKDPNHMLR